MRRFFAFALVVGLSTVPGNPALAENQLAAFRCAGAGTLSAVFTTGPNPPATAGYQWFLAADGACVLSPQGPWLFTASGSGYNGSCGSIPAVTATTATP
jgi:hypothetical protein